ncbi:hypothetical protein LAZ67_15001410 [Cordylochernes scorpioides]|uniref:Transposase n=1 Tax=Cordylochernes scorpioides TaxID=51811 RepID=A0ABY6LBA3_9ARAC|nr:hypothetical protein LAZ67_15001410 [Cordylochernes scorpioides]
MGGLIFYPIQVCSFFPCGKPPFDQDCTHHQNHPISTQPHNSPGFDSESTAIPQTISRRLVANGLHSCRPLRRLPLTPPNRRQRLEWCRARSTWMTEWHRVVFSDESRFCLSSDSRRVRVWRRRGERSNPAAIVERPTVRQRGIMVWGAIAYDSRSPLLRIQGTMTAQRYVDDVLRPVTLPYLQGVPNALYQQDNARPRTARISQQALQDAQMLPWPPYSPELSPIEHVWDIIGRRLHALPQPRSEDELWQMTFGIENRDLDHHGRTFGIENTDLYHHGRPLGIETRDLDRHGRTFGIENTDLYHHGRPLGIENRDLDRHGRTLGIENTDLYRHGRTLGIENRDLDRHGWSLVIENTDLYRHGRTLGIENRDLVRHGWSLVIENTDLYRNGRTLGIENRDLDRHGRTLVIENTDLYRHGRTLGIENRDLDRHGRTLVIENRDLDRHGRTLGIENRNLYHHGRTLGIENRDLDRHGRTLVIENRDLDRHGRTLVIENTDLYRHGRTLGIENRDLDRHGRTLGIENRDLDRHGRTLVIENRDLDRHGRPLGTRTISRRLVANGLHSCRPLRRLPLTPPNRRQRLEWCRARSTWMTEWHRVVFSDESRFCLSSDSRRVRVWRRRGERSNPAAIVERPTVRQRGIMVWGAIAYDSRSPLLRIQGTMTAQRYVDDVLRPVTLPYLQGVPNALYQQDNARPHTARISQQALQDVQMLPWPPYSPELSPIEHVWDIIGRRLHALPQPRSEDELWQMAETADEDIVKAFLSTDALSQLPGDKSVRVAHRSPTRNGTCTAFIELDLASYKVIGRRGRIIVDQVILNYEESVRVRVCYSCCGYGHNPDRCTKATVTCFHCASGDHQGRSCPTLANPRTAKCANCLAKGLSADHEARSMFCPTARARAAKF